MAERVVITCDNCTAEPAEQLSVTLDTLHANIDLCGGCQDAVGLPKLRLLLDEYGVLPATAVVVAQPHPVARFRCPVCKTTSAARGAILSHCQHRHNMDSVEASRAVPPRGAARECAVCGFVASQGKGYASHVAARHPDAS